MLIWQPTTRNLAKEASRDMSKKSMKESKIINVWKSRCFKLDAGNIFVRAGEKADRSQNENTS